MSTPIEPTLDAAAAAPPPPPAATQAVPAGPALAEIPKLTDPEIEHVVETYKREMARFEEAALLVEARLRRELRAQAVRCLSSSRAKHPDDLREKLQRKRDLGDAKYTVSALNASIGRVVTDLAGVRILTYEPDDVDKARNVVKQQLRMADVSNNDEVKKDEHGYWAVHALVEVPPDEERVSLRGTICEVQITTVAAHVYNELEHDIRYKTHGVNPSDAEAKTLLDLRGAARLLDRSAERLLHERAQTLVRTKRELMDAGDLQHVMEMSAGRKLSGDFQRLFRFLNSCVRKLTAATLETIGPGTTPELLKRGETVAAAAQWDDADDVAKIVIALYASRKDELTAFVSRPGRPGSFRKAVDVAAGAGAA